MKKKFLLLTSLTILSLSLIACGKKEIEGKNGKELMQETVEVTSDVMEEVGEAISEVSTETTETEETTESSELTNVSKSQKCAIDFIQYVQTENYEEALNLLNIPDKTFVSSDDLQWFIPRSDLSDLVGTDMKYSDISESGDKTDTTVKLTYGDTEIQLNVIMDNDNNYKINFPDFCMQDWTLYVPKDTVVSIKDVVVEETYLTSEEEFKDVYTIPYIALRETELKVTSSVYGDFNIVTTPSTDKDGKYTVICSLDNTSRDTLIEGVKTAYNEFCAIYETGRDVSEITPYLASNASEDMAQNIYNAVEEAFTWNGQKENIRYTQVFANDESEYPAVLVTDTVVELNLKVEKTWGRKGTRLYDGVRVTKENDEVKIYSIDFSDTSLTESNGMTNKWE